VNEEVAHYDFTERNPHVAHVPYIVVTVSSIFIEVGCEPDIED
jgi:hypothetical protein